MAGAIVDQDHSARAVVLGVHHFAEKLRVLGVDFAGEYALLVELLRFVTQDQRQLVLDVHAGVIVVVVFARRDSVSDEDDAARDLSARGKVEGNEFVFEFECGGLSVRGVFEAVARAQFGVGGDRERLQVALAVGRLKARRFELFGDIGGRFLQLRRAGGAAAHRVGSQKLHVGHVALRIDLVDRMPRSAQKQESNWNKLQLVEWGGNFHCDEPPNSAWAKGASPHSRNPRPRSWRSFDIRSPGR